MSTFEGPLLSVKSVNALSHYTDWTIAHVHSGALGWNGFMIFGMIYFLVPRLWNTELYSVKLAKKAGIQAIEAGVVQKGKRQVILDPLKITFTEESLQIR